MLGDFYRLFFPNLCAICGEGLINSETFICTSCRYAMPKVAENSRIERLFWGKVELVACYAYYRFEKGGSVQKLIYELKYRGLKEIGELVGKWMAQDLKSTPLLKAVDFIVPVPLHRSKQKKRGYNQSEHFAMGLANVLGVPVSADSLIRLRSSSSQTKKSRFLRWKNTTDEFSLKPNHPFHNKHLLLVDDVITTGATLEASANALINGSGATVSVAAIAAA
jgi:ComF family protein